MTIVYPVIVVQVIIGQHKTQYIKLLKSKQSTHKCAKYNRLVLEAKEFNRSPLKICLTSNITQSSEQCTIYLTHKDNKIISQML